jgi:PIN domain-containing protein
LPVIAFELLSAVNVTSHNCQRLDVKAHFSEYHRPTAPEFRALWQTAIVGLDANVLLNLYGYSDATREDLLNLLERLQSRIRMAHQFAVEYHRNRAHAIMEQVKNYVNVERLFADIYEKEFKPKTKHPFLSPRTLKLFEAVRRELVKGRQQHEALFSNDPFFRRITALVGKVSSKPTETELAAMYEQAKKRYAVKIPPGYADLKEKGEPKAFGDYIGWRQLIAIAKEEGKPLLLITDDAKEDWWQMEGDRTIGPRPELIAEFQLECGSSFYMYSSGQFMRLAGKYLRQPVRQDAIDEVTERLTTRIREASAQKSVAKQAMEDANTDKPFLVSEEATSSPAKPTEVESSPNKKPTDPTPKTEKAD